MTTSTRTKLLDRWERIGGGAGIAFVALTLVGGIVQGDVPVYTEGPTAAKEWLAENSDRYLVGSLLIVLAVLFFLALLAALVAVLLSADKAPGPWPWLALLAGVHLVVAAQASVALDPTLALLQRRVSDDLARTLSAADYMTFSMVYPFPGVLTLAVSLSILRTRVLWRSLALFGPLVTLGGLVAATARLQHDAEGALTTVGYVTLLALLVWTAAISVSMIRAGETPQEAKERTGRGDHYASIDRGVCSLTDARERLLSAPERVAELMGTHAGTGVPSVICAIISVSAA